MAIFKNYEEDFKKLNRENEALKKEIKMVQETASTLQNDVAAMNRKLTQLQRIWSGEGRIGSELDEIKQLLFNLNDQSQMTDVEVPELNVHVAETVPKNTNSEFIHKYRNIPKSHRRPYKSLCYSIFGFYAKTGIGNELFTISDIVRVAKYISDLENYRTMSSLHEKTIPSMSRSAFVRLIYNYQIGFFDEILKDYWATTKFSISNSYLLINGYKTLLTQSDAKEIIALIINSSDKEECLNNLINSYNSEKTKWIRIVADHYNNPQLSAILSRHEEIQIENNPQKRKEKAL